MCKGRHQNLTEIRYLYSVKIAKHLRHLIFRAEAIYQDYSDFQARISPQGIVNWEPGGVFKTMCRIDITYYPFDRQE